MVGIMGASGAGKSTLLFVLNGTNAPSSGEVLINGHNIHTAKGKVEGVIGFVSQDDLLIEDLTVFQNLYYNAKLCFDNYTEEQIVDTVNKTLVNLGLFEIKDIQVGTPLNKKISGGQRKRLNIALNSYANHRFFSWTNQHQVFLPAIQKIYGSVERINFKREAGFCRNPPAFFRNI